MKKIKIFKYKKYNHFDKKKNYHVYISHIKNSKWIERHAFYPFIHFEEEKEKFKGVGIEINKKNPRNIYYSSHIDRYIYEYYNFQLSQQYNKYVKKNGINHVAVAYRNNLQKGNIDISKDVFNFLNNQENAFVLVSDFSGFFDCLDHKYLKDRIKDVLALNTLPDDYYKVLKSITKYAYIDYVDILKELNMTNKQFRKEKMERLFEISDFRKIKKEYIHVNKEKFGIVQGSAISSTMSNVYMIKFDKLINDLVTSNSGIYRRYSDDIIIVIPNIRNVKDIYHKINEIKNKVPNLEFSLDKTKFFLKQKDIIQEVDILNNKIIINNTIIDYLGFTYDGKIVKIREKSVSKYYRKMYSRIKTINKYACRKGINLGRRKLYKNYSYIGKNEKEYKKRNFLTYVDIAKEKYGKLGDFDRQVKRSWTYMSKKLIKVDKNK